MIEVHLQDAFKSEADAVIARLKDECAKASIPFADMIHTDPQSLADAGNIQINIAGIPATQAGNFRQIVNDNFGNGWVLTNVNPTDFRMNLKQTEVLKIKADALVADQGHHCQQDQPAWFERSDGAIRAAAARMKRSCWCSCRAWTIRRT